jgi:acyl-CoA reductase-like NAD-dependent aldehyde dehydrogenase
MVDLKMPVVSGAFPLQTESQQLSPAARADLDSAVDALNAHKTEWVRLGVPDRLALLAEVTHDMQAIADEWVQACTAAKQIKDNAFALGEEWLFLAAVFRLLRLLRQSLGDIQQHGTPQLPNGVATQRPNGQPEVAIFPQTQLDRLLFLGTTASVWLQADGCDSPARAAFYRQPPTEGAVMLVLGAGNVSSLGVGDLLHALFVKGQVVILKPNPINAYLGPLIERGFQALVRRSYLRVVYGDAATGAYLTHHPKIDSIHLTGSDKTFEAIVFGPDAAAKKKARQPVVAKPVSAELGNVTPIIVVPGPWSKADVQTQAQKIAAWLVVNAGFNCLTPRVIVQHADWPLRQPLLAAIEQALRQVPTRQAYYPGAANRQAQFLTAHRNALQIGNSANGHLPWTLIPNVDAADTGNIAFRSEAFCGLMTETALAADDPAEFVARAVAFANHTLWGTLTATLLVHPKSRCNPTLRSAIEWAVAELRYGTVVVNQYGGFGYYLMVTPWGGFPGANMFDVQSGIGFVNNTLMFDRPQKAVIRSPFRQWPDPFSLGFGQFDKMARQLARFEANPTPAETARLLGCVFRGAVG